MKPSILKEVSEENKLIPLPTRFNFVDDDDILILEDELNRIRLIGDIDIHQIATGVVCAVLGKFSQIQNEINFSVFYILIKQ